MPAEVSPTERSLRPYTSTEKYLLALREDLAEWLNSMYPDCAIDAETFFCKLETGVLLCKHINNIIERLQTIAPSYLLPASTRYQLPCRTNVQPGTFQARDNICSCLRWLRAMRTKECLLFETDDLVLRKNEKSVILCLLELSRIGARVGLSVPTIIQFEKEIDADELQHSSATTTATIAGSDYCSSDDIYEAASSLSTTSSSGGSSLTISAESLSATPLLSSLKNVDQVVTEQVKECRCQTTFPLVKVAPGKYRVGPSRLIIYVRILRNHVMVRVGGGWDTLEHFLEKHDPCRRRGCCSEALRGVPAASSANNMTKLQSPPPPSVHRQKTDLTPLQVVFNRGCRKSDPLHPTTDPASKTTVSGIRRHVGSDEPSIPAKVELRRSNIGSAVPRAPRARSMDVGVLLDQLREQNSARQPPQTVGKSQNSAARSEMPSTVTTGRGAMTNSVTLPELKPNPKKRQSLIRLEEIPSVRREKAVTDLDVANETWDTAFNRHRQNFLRLKNIFSGSDDTQSSGKPPLKYDETVQTTVTDMRGIHMGSPISPDPSDSSVEEAEPSDKSKLQCKQGSLKLSKKISLEDGFYSDASSSKSE